MISTVIIYRQLEWWSLSKLRSQEYSGTNLAVERLPPPDIVNKQAEIIQIGVHQVSQGHM